MLTCCPQLLRHFVYQDTGSILDLCRPSVLIMLYPNELPRVSVVCLSHDDDLVPCDLVQKHLKETIQPQPGGKGKMLDVILSKGPHGAFLALAEIQDRMLLSFRDGIKQAYG
jgi:hypothetical protein